MHTTVSHVLRPSLVIIAAATLFAACSDDAPSGPSMPPTARPAFAAAQALGPDAAIATLRRVTARYHELDVALKDQFVQLHPCEELPGEGPVGTVYVNFARLLDGVIDPEKPDALIYEPAPNGRLKLVGVEFAVLNTGQPAPQFLGHTFQDETEFGVWALHAWVWRHNPKGMFEETNPRVSCGAA
jgi:hypothetical protein